MTNIRIYHQLEGAAEKRFDYVVNFLNYHPLKPRGWQFILTETEKEEGCSLAYGTSVGDWRIPVQGHFFQDKTVADYFPNPYHYEGTTFYSVEHSPKALRPLLVDKVFQFDLFETIFFHITRYEEVFAGKEEHNQAGWLKEELHFLIRHQLNTLPVVDQLVNIFFEILTETRIKRQTDYSISHDLDLLGRFTPTGNFIQSIAATIFRRQDLQELKNSTGYFVKMLLGNARDPYDYFPTLLRPETNWQHKTLYLMAGGETAYDNKYRLDDPRMDEVIDLAQERGYHIGLHPSYNAGFKESLYREEWEKLSERIGEPVRFNRQHWLRMDWQQTPYLWEKVGIEVDSTLGYSRYLGFRCGTGFPYHLYDFQGEKSFSFEEHPFAFMDSAAVHVSLKHGISLQKVLEAFWEEVPGETEVLFNFHNSSFDPLTNEGIEFRRFYEQEVIGKNTL